MVSIKLSGPVLHNSASQVKPFFLALALQAVLSVELKLCCQTALQVELLIACSHKIPNRGLRRELKLEEADIFSFILYQSPVRTHFK
jgi:hypothetical protein